MPQDTTVRSGIKHLLRRPFLDRVQQKIVFSDNATLLFSPFNVPVLKPRTRNILLAATAVLLFCLTVWHRIRLAMWGQWTHWGWETLFHVSVTGTFAIVYWLLTSYYENRRQGPIRTLWTTFLVVFGAIVISSLAGLSYIKGDLIFEHKIADQSLQGIWTHALIVLLQGLSSIYLLVQLRELILFRRSQSTLLNWNSLLLSILGAYISSLLYQAFRLPYIQEFFIALAGLLMLINVFRLSWVAYLSFQAKLISSLFTILLLAVLLVAFGEAVPNKVFDFIVWRSEPFSHQYSPALSMALVLTWVFGILYCLTALLSLIFHLPTSSDFQKKTDDLAALHTLTKLSSQVFDAGNLPNVILEAVMSDHRHQSAWLALADIRSGTVRPRIVATSGIAVEQIESWLDEDGFYTEINARREPLILNHAASDRRVKAPLYEMGSLAVLPLSTRNEMLGVLFLAKSVTEGFEEDDARSLSTFADQAAMALDNARLLEERIEKERLGRELAIARDVQNRLLPQTLPQVAGASLFASYEFAYEVGGDYYDFVSLSDHQYSFIIADVSGKGTSAAFYMAALKGIYQALARLSQHPKDLLIRANEALYAQKEKNIFITAIAGQLDVEKETLILARAGHAPALHINLNGAIRQIRSNGLGLGLARDPMFAQTLEQETLTMRPGDVFVFYTDGVIESRNTEGESYGYDRLMAALQKSRHEDAEGIHAALIHDLNTFTGNLRYFDDLTLLVFKWHGVQVQSIQIPAGAGEK